MKEFSGEIQEIQNIYSVVVDERYNGQIDIEDKKSGELEDLSKVKGKIGIENCIHGGVERPSPYKGQIDTIDDIEGEIVLPDITDALTSSSTNTPAVNPESPNT